MAKVAAKPKKVEKLRCAADGCACQDRFDFVGLVPVLLRGGPMRSDRVASLMVCKCGHHQKQHGWFEVPDA